jgi:hypothetical protein
LIQIGELIFATKAAAIEHFRAMLYRYGRDDLVNESDTRELLWLLDHRPTAEQKRGAGVIGFAIADAPYGQRGFRIIRSDWSSTDFSYRKCIAAPPTALAMVLKALRKEVEDDILTAKRTYFERNGDEAGRVPCLLTGALITIDQADADHAPPYTFDVLARTFLSARQIEADVGMITPPADNQFGRTLVDRALAADWREFHHLNADVRIVAKVQHRTMSQENRRKVANRQLVLSPGEETEGGVG